MTSTGEQGARAGEPDGWAGETDVDETVLALRSIAASRAVADAELIAASRALLARVQERVLAQRDLVGIELTKTQQATVASAARSLAAAELELAAGFGVGEARTLIKAASAPGDLARLVEDALRRGESSWPLVRAFHEATAGLGPAQRLLVAQSLFGPDPALAAADRLDPDGDLHGRPWGYQAFSAALESEVTAARAADPEDERNRRARAYERRRVSVRVHDDGTATLRVTGPSASIVAGGQRLDRAARTLRRQGDPRTLDQLRADTAQTLLMYGTVPLPGTGADADTDTDTATGGTSTPHTTTSADTPTTGDATDAHGDEEQGVKGSGREGSGGECGGDDGGGDDGSGGDGSGGDGSESQGDERDQDALFDDALAPDDIQHMLRVLNALPTVTLQVVVPYAALAGGFAVCVRCGHTSELGDHPPDGPPPDGPRADGPPPDGPPPDGRPAARSRLRGRVAQVLGPNPFFITDHHARELALFPGTTLHRLVTDPLDGRLVERSIATYRPDTDMRRQVIAADQLSRAPGPRTGAHAGELDHVTPYGWAGGSTSELNLALLAKRPHRFKTEGLWHLSLDTRRDLTVTTLLGQVVTTRTHDYRTYLHGPARGGGAAAGPAAREARRDRAGQLIHAALADHPANRYRARTGQTCVDLDPPASGRAHPTLVDLLGLDEKDDVSTGEGPVRTKDRSDAHEPTGTDDVA
ncbi:hypothetical protein [Ornithinimicrobium tianjinense]|uniref:hypothetical protein n=1 Tax=Ornithinimicrobium tianjinense TaxID=1195761 RepID=UPI001667184D|nr:hypothetical protein [Ornithinimicrobium tianjinense]